MGDRVAEWTGRRALGVDVNPLVVTSRLGEQIDLLLGDGQVVGIAEVGTNEWREVFDAVHVRGHVHLPSNLTGHL